MTSQRGRMGAEGREGVAPRDTIELRAFAGGDMYAARTDGNLLPLHCGLVEGRDGLN